jgi:hypothetical protein
MHALHTIPVGLRGARPSALSSMFFLRAARTRAGPLSFWRGRQLSEDGRQQATGSLSLWHGTVARLSSTASKTGEERAGGKGVGASVKGVGSGPGKGMGKLKKVGKASGRGGKGAGVGAAEGKAGVDRPASREFWTMSDTELLEVML